MAADGRPPGAPFALGTFVNEGRAFTGLVRDERVADLTAHLGAGVSLRTLLDDWDATFARLQRLQLRAAAESCGLVPHHPNRWGVIWSKLRAAGWERTGSEAASTTTTRNAARESVWRRP